MFSKKIKISFSSPSFPHMKKGSFPYFRLAILFRSYFGHRYAGWLRMCKMELSSQSSGYIHKVTLVFVEGEKILFFA